MDIKKEEFEIKQEELIIKDECIFITEPDSVTTTETYLSEQYEHEDCCSQSDEKMITETTRTMDSHLRRNKTSVIWNFFTVQDEIKATCNFCTQSISYKSSISNLKQHLRRKHPKIKMLPQLQTTNRSSSPTEDTPGVSTTATATVASCSSGPRQKPVQLNVNKNIDDCVLQMVTADFQPFSIVEDVGFRAFANALNPLYTLPSRKMLSETLLPSKFAEAYKRAQEIIQDAVSVTITTDCWTSCKNESFVALTAHYISGNFEIRNLLLEVNSYSESDTSQNLATEIKRIATEWGLSDDKILLAVSDNAGNIKKAVTEELNWPFLGCLAHTINLIVQDALETIRPLIDKVKTIVGYFRRSAAAKHKLDSYQRQNGQQPKKLIQCVSTRWNSAYFMMERFLEIEEEVRAALGALGKEDISALNNEESQTLRQITEILSPMENVTRTMTAEKYVSLSSVIVINNCLQDIYDNLKTKSLSGKSKEVATAINAGLRERLKNLESNSTLLISTFLDPRFKNVGFSSEVVSDYAKSKVSDFLTNFIVKHGKMDELKVSIASTSTCLLSKDSVWDAFDRKAASFTPAGSTKTRAIIELQRYLEEPLLPRNCDPLIWWKSQAYNYPNLSQIAIERLGTVATSIPCERIFSATGELLSSRRNRLGSEEVKQIMFVNRNSWN